MTASTPRPTRRGHHYEAPFLVTKLRQLERGGCLYRERRRHPGTLFAASLRSARMTVLKKDFKGCLYAR